MTREISEVYLILDPQFGDKIASLPTGTPAWIIMSKMNEPFIRRWWAENRESSLESGITGFLEQPLTDSYFASQLDNIELHHGPYSEVPPFRSLKVLGMRLTDQARQELLAFGFEEISETDEGFVAMRTEQEALVRRYDRSRFPQNQRD